MGIWAVPNTVKKAERLKMLLTKNMSRAHAEAEMYLLLGSDNLFDDFKETVRGEDIRPIIARRLKEILDMPESSFSAQWEPEARSICESIIADYGLQADIQPDKPVVFVSWSVEDILELLEGNEGDLDMTVEEIHEALIYAARQGYHSGPDSILDSIRDAHRVLTSDETGMDEALFR